MGASAFLRWRSFESLAQADYQCERPDRRGAQSGDALQEPVRRELTATLSVSRTDSLLYRLEGCGPPR